MNRDLPPPSEEDLLSFTIEQLLDIPPIDLNSSSEQLYIGEDIGTLLDNLSATITSLSSSSSNAPTPQPLPYSATNPSPLLAQQQYYPLEQQYDPPHQNAPLLQQHAPPLQIYAPLQYTTFPFPERRETTTVTLQPSPISASYENFEIPSPSTTARYKRNSIEFEQSYATTTTTGNPQYFQQATEPQTIFINEVPSPRANKRPRKASTTSSIPAATTNKRSRGKKQEAALLGQTNDSLKDDLALMQSKIAELTRGLEHQSQTNLMLSKMAGVLNSTHSTVPLLPGTQFKEQVQNNMRIRTERGTVALSEEDRKELTEVMAELHFNNKSNTVTVIHQL